MRKVAIVDYSVGNIFSLRQMCIYIETEPYLVSRPEELKIADAIILPGVGAFGKAMENLKSRGMEEAIIEFIKKGKPYFGICLGMQILFSESEEFEAGSGLNLLRGKVMSFRGRVDSKLPVPQIMWNSVYFTEKICSNSPFAETSSGTDFYFAHSFYCDTGDDSILGYSEYGDIRYCSALLKENIFATQFHPEKSGLEGIKIFKNWKLNYL